MEIGRAAVIALLMTAVVEGGDVTIEKGIRYLPPGRAETLDLYLPPADLKSTGKRPGIVIIHGGGWTGGDKGAKREINIGTTLASHGYVCVSINYALAAEGRPTWPGNLKDCKRAVRWLRRNAEKYGIDPDHIGAIGGSAGGHLTAMLAVTGPEDGFEPEEDPRLSSRVQAAVPMYPAAAAGLNHDHVMFPGKQTEMPEVYRAAAPINHVTRDDAPMLILHGTADTTTPLSGSQLLRRQARGGRRRAPARDRRGGATQLRPAALATRFEGARHRVLRQAPEGRKAVGGAVSVLFCVEQITTDTIYYSLTLAVALLACSGSGMELVYSLLLPSAGRLELANHALVILLV